jgi:AcrR family transcriptional regulator
MGHTYRSAAAGSPIADMPPKAQAIIRAAQRILKRDGFAKLSFETIAAESGVYASAIRYYFGSKGGLIEALVDAPTHDVSLEIRERWRSELDAQMRLRAAILESSRLAVPEVYQSQWEMLPHILRSERLKKFVAGLYELHRQHYDELFQAADDALSREAVRCYASLSIAVLDGIAIQKSLDANVDVDAIFALWVKILSGSVKPSEIPVAGEIRGDAGRGAAGPS